MIFTKRVKGGYCICKLMIRLFPCIISYPNPFMTPNVNYRSNYKQYGK